MASALAAIDGTLGLTLDRRDIRGTDMAGRVDPHAATPAAIRP